MFTPQSKRIRLSVNAWIFGISLLVPGSGWAISYTYTLPSPSFFNGSVLNFDGPIGNLAFSNTQNVSFNTNRGTHTFTNTSSLTPTTWSPTDSILGPPTPAGCPGGWIHCEWIGSFSATISPGPLTIGGISQILTFTARETLSLDQSDSNCSLTFPAICKNFRIPKTRPFKAVILEPRTLNAVPEPGTILLLGTGLLGLAGYRWHQRRREGSQVG